MRSEWCYIGTIGKEILLTYFAQLHMEIPKLPGVYMIRHEESSKVYIGHSNNMHKRIREHKNALLKGIHKNCYLQSAWNQYSADSFYFSYIEIIEDPEQLVAIEQYWINKFTSYKREKGFNLSPRANKPLGAKMSDETKRKMSEARTGKVFTEEHRRNIGLMFKGRKLSEEHKRKIGASQIGRPKISDEGRAKLSQLNKGKKMSAESRAKMSASKKALHANRKNGGASCSQPNLISST